MYQALVTYQSLINQYKTNIGGLIVGLIITCIVGGLIGALAGMITGKDFPLGYSW